MTPESKSIRGETAAGDRPTATNVQKMVAAAIERYRAGQLAEAEKMCRDVLALDPRHADSLHILGVIASQTGFPARAVERISAAIEINGAVAAYHSNLGNALRQLGRLDEAAVCHGRALALQPDYAPAHNNLGTVLDEQGHPEAAEAAFRQAIGFSPNYPPAHVNLGNVLSKMGRLEEAIGCYRQALALNPSDFVAFNQLGIALQDAGRLDESRSAFRRAIRIKPNYALAHANLGSTLRRQGELSDAVASYREALGIEPGFAQAHTGLGVALKEQGNLEGAIASYRQALRLKPDLADAHWNLALALLSQGSFPEGLEEHEWRRRWPFWIEQNEREFAEDLWRGEPGSGKTILLWLEQGFGDSIQFVRYAPLVAARDWRVILEVPRPLKSLFGTVEDIELVVRGEPLPRIHAQCPLLSLPRLFGTTMDTIPAPIPYLRADRARAQQWRSWIGDRRGLKVGLAWRGKATHVRDRHRSIEPRLCATFLAVPGIVPINLQKDAGPEEIAALAADKPLFDAAPGFGDFADTAALIANLDLVISVDTAVCHLAGALGVPTWTLLDFAPDWRWFRQRDDSPWYPTMRLLRQPRVGDWQAVVDAARDALLARVASNPGDTGTSGAKGAAPRPT